MAADDGKAPDAVIVSGERFIVGEGPESAMASANVYWLGALTGRTEAERERYAHHAAWPGFWLHTDADAAFAGMRKAVADAATDTRGWNPDVYRVRMELARVGDESREQPEAWTPGPGEIIVSGQRFALGPGPWSVMATVHLFWLKPLLSTDARELADYDRIRATAGPEWGLYTEVSAAFDVARHLAARPRDGEDGASGVYRVRMELARMPEVSA